jgi:signal transduction histidine kinase
MDYAQLVHETVAEMQLMNGQNEIAHQGPDTALVRGNPERLRQVLVNHIDNAVKHGPQGGIVSVLVEVDSHHVITRVTDEGPGVPEGEDERIFHPYYQVRESARHHAKGLGLGLYITRQIVSEHGGSIWLDMNGKTSFCFTVPASQKG